MTQSCILGCTLQVRAHSLALTTAETRPHRPGSGRPTRACHVLPNFAPISGNDSSAIRHFAWRIAHPRFTRTAVPSSSLFETLPHPPCVSPFHPPGLFSGTLSFSSPSPRLGPAPSPALHASSALRAAPSGHDPDLLAHRILTRTGQPHLPETGSSHGPVRPHLPVRSRP